MSVLLSARTPATVIQFPVRPAQAGFTCRDLMELDQWDGAGRRVAVDPEVRDELGQFALIYDGAQPWASWAISREGACVLVWDCISLADIGRFASMRDALAAVPGGTGGPAQATAGAEVICFGAALARRSAA